MLSFFESFLNVCVNSNFKQDIAFQLNLYQMFSMYTFRRKDRKEVTRKVNWRKMHSSKDVLAKQWQLSATSIYRLIQWKVWLIVKNLYFNFHISFCLKLQYIFKAYHLEQENNVRWKCVIWGKKTKWKKKKEAVTTLHFLIGVIKKYKIFFLFSNAFNITAVI